MRRRHAGVADAFGRYAITYSLRGLRDFPILAGAIANLTYARIARLPAPPESSPRYSDRIRENTQPAWAATKPSNGSRKDRFDWKRASQSPPTTSFSQQASPFSFSEFGPFSIALSPSSPAAALPMRFFLLGPNSRYPAGESPRG